MPDNNPISLLVWVVVLLILIALAFAILDRI